MSDALRQIDGGFDIDDAAEDERLAYEHPEAFHKKQSDECLSLISKKLKEPPSPSGVQLKSFSVTIIGFQHLEPIF